MNSNNSSKNSTNISVTKVALITGAAQRIGAEIATLLQKAGYCVMIHYNHSKTEAEQLAKRLNAEREESAFTFSSDLNSQQECKRLIEKTLSINGNLNALINNASQFFPTVVDEVTETQWQQLFDTNLKAPFTLAQKAASALKQSSGSIVNITDIHGSKPLQGYSVYSMSKAGLISMTQSLAKELAPEVRVNAVSPGAILWPQEEAGQIEKQQDIISKIPLKRLGSTKDIAQAVLFLLQNNYITGQIINVDGGRSLSQ